MCCCPTFDFIFEHCTSMLYTLMIRPYRYWKWTNARYYFFFVRRTSVKIFPRSAKGKEILLLTWLLWHEKKYLHFQEKFQRKKNGSPMKFWIWKKCNKICFYNLTLWKLAGLIITEKRKFYISRRRRGKRQEDIAPIIPRLENCS